MIGQLESGKTESSAPAAPTVAVAPMTPEYRLALIYSNGAEPQNTEEFARILDVIQTGNQICAPEPDRVHVADVIVSSWETSGKKDSLLTWAQSLASVCE